MTLEFFKKFVNFSKNTLNFFFKIGYADNEILLLGDLHFLAVSVDINGVIYCMGVLSASRFSCQRSLEQLTGTSRKKKYKRRTHLRKIRVSNRRSPVHIYKKKQRKRLAITIWSRRSKIKAHLYCSPRPE